MTDAQARKTELVLAGIEVCVCINCAEVVSHPLNRFCDGCWNVYASEHRQVPYDIRECLCPKALAVL